MFLELSCFIAASSVLTLTSQQLEQQAVRLLEWVAVRTVLWLVRLACSEGIPRQGAMLTSIRWLIVGSAQRHCVL